MKTENLLTTMGVYFFITGLWPILHIKSFMWVTGPKKEIWLVKTVGLLVINSSLLFLLPWFYGTTASFELKALAIMNAFSLMIIDIYYALTGRIRKIYLLDAGVEAFFLINFIFAA